MDPTGGRDTRYNLNYMMSESPEIYGNPNVSLAARPPSGGLVGQVMSRGGTGTGLMNTNGPQCGSGGGGGGAGGGGGGGGGGGLSRGIKRTNSDCYDDRQQQLVGSQTMTGLDGCNVGSEVVDDTYTSLQPKKSPPSNGKKTKGRVKIKMEYIDNKLRRYTTFSKRKTGIMKKAYELSTLTGTQVMLLVASETGHVYTFATRKLQPMITSEAGKALIQTCLNSPDPPTGSSGDQRMSATGFEETELSYNIGDEDSKDDRSPMSSGSESDDYSPPESPPPGPSVSTSSNNNASGSNNLHHQQHGSASEKSTTGSSNSSRNVGSQNSSGTASSGAAGSSATSVMTATSAAAKINAIQQQIQQQQQALQQQIQHRQQQQQQQKQQPKSGKSKSSSVKVKQEPVAPDPVATPETSTPAVAAAATTTASAAPTTASSQITSSIIYPASALSTLPQDVLINLLQSGQIQLHSEGGTQQYVTIPLPLMSGKAATKTTCSMSPSSSSSSLSTANGQPKASSSTSAAFPITSSSSRSGSGRESSSRRNQTASSIKTEVVD